MLIIIIILYKIFTTTEKHVAVSEGTSYLFLVLLRFDLTECFVVKLLVSGISVEVIILCALNKTSMNMEIDISSFFLTKPIFAGAGSEPLGFSH